MIIKSLTVAEISTPLLQCFNKVSKFTWVRIITRNVPEKQTDRHKIFISLRCVAQFWYHLDNLKNVKSIHGGVSLLILKVALLHGCFSRF